MFVYRWPIVTQFGGLTTVLALYAGTFVARQLALCFLADKYGTRLYVRVQKSFPPIQHMYLHCERTDMTIEMAFQGRQDLRTAFTFRATREKVPQDPMAYSIPVPINFPAVTRKMMALGGSYTPWFNCQTVMPAITDYNAVITLVVLFAQCVNAPVTYLAYTMFALAYRANPKFCELHTGDFFRMGTTREWELLEEESTSLFAALEADWAPHQTDQAPAFNAVPAYWVASVAEDGTVTLNPTYDKESRPPSILEEATRAMKAGDLPTLDEMIMHAAELAEHAKEQGVDDVVAYHAATIALHDMLMAMPEDEEVKKWKTEFKPKNKKSVAALIQELALWIDKHLHVLPTAFRAAFTRLYQWIEGLAANAKSHAVKIFRLVQYFGDRLADVSSTLWRSFSLWANEYIEFLFGKGLAKRLKTVWALGGVAKNPRMAAQRKLQEMYAMAKYERSGVFEQDYIDAVANIKSNLPPAHLARDDPERLFKNTTYHERVKKEKWLFAPSDVAGMGGTQFRPVRVPGKPVMSGQEAAAIFGEGWERRVWEDVALTEQVAAKLARGATQTMDHCYDVAKDSTYMYEMQERYSYYGLTPNPIEDPVPPIISDDRYALYDELARVRVENHPEKYANRRLTDPKALMNYIEWPRSSGPMFEGRPTVADRHRTPMNDLTKRWKMWEAGLGYAVIKKAYADAAEGRVDMQQFGAFVKSQPTPVAKLGRGVTFMPITQWFKGMMECFAQNQRVTWRTTYVGKNMPLNQHMSQFFERVKAMPVKFEADAKQMDSRFETLQLYGVGRIAHHAWANNSPYVTNGAAIASHKAERYKALADGVIFNLHVEKGKHAPKWMKTHMAHPNAAKYSNVTSKIRGGATGLEDTTDLNSDAADLMLAATLVDYGLAIGRPITPRDAMDESKILFIHTSDDNITGMDLEKLYGLADQEIDTELFKQCAARNNLDLTIIYHQKDEGRFLEYLSHFSRPLTVRDARTIDRVNSLYRERGIYSPDQELLDPMTGLPPTHVVYQNTKAMDSRQTANNAYKQFKFRDRYLMALIARDVGQAQLKAMNPQSYLYNSQTYLYNAIRYLAHAAFPAECSDENGLALYPADPKQLEWIKSHFHVKYEDVGMRMPIYRIDGNVRAKTFPASNAGIPAEFASRLRDLKLAKFPDYSKVVADHFKPTKKPADWADRILRKINRGVLGADEGAKEIVDALRVAVENIPRKLSKGVVPTLDMLYPDELWDGSGRIEAAVYLAEEEEAQKAGLPVTAGAFSRRLNQSPYTGATNGSAKFYEFNTKEGRERLHRYPLFVYKNMITLISVVYAFFWYLERWILSLPFLGLAWAIMMFYMIDVTRIYAIAGLLAWHHTMAANPIISGLMPRDIYVHSKRFADWSCSFIPLEVGLFLRFDIAFEYVSDCAVWFAMVLQYGRHLTPQTGTQPGFIQNEWEPVAATVMNELAAAPEDARVVSIKGSTGTGKSSFFVYALHRLNLIERGGVLHLVAPFEVLRDDWSLPSMFGFGSHDTPEHERNSLYQVMKGSSKPRPNARVFLWTYGTFAQAVQDESRVGKNDIVCLDESHIGTPAAILSAKRLQQRGIWSVNLSATPAPVKKLVQGKVIDANAIVTKKWRTKQVEFPESTSAVAMLQQMCASTEMDETIGHSHATLARRLIVKCNTERTLTEFKAACDDVIRKEFSWLPKVYIFSGANKHNLKTQNEEMAKAGEYIIAATDMIEVGYDVKPAAYAIIDTGYTIKEHQGFLGRPSNSTSTQMEQFHGRVGRNSSDRPGLVYHSANAGTGTPAQVYGNGSFYVHQDVCESIGMPRLCELPFKSGEVWNYFTVRADGNYDERMTHALRFVFLAAMSGVDPRGMPQFYDFHGVQGRKMPEAYEWLETRLAGSKNPVFEFPSWRIVETALLQLPFIVAVEGNKVVGREDVPGEPALSRVGPIYPRGASWMSYHTLSNMRNSVKIKGTITSESSAFEEILAAKEAEIAELQKKFVTVITSTADRIKDQYQEGRRRIEQAKGKGKEVEHSDDCDKKHRRGSQCNARAHIDVFAGARVQAELRRAHAEFASFQAASATASAIAATIPARARAAAQESRRRFTEVEPTAASAAQHGLAGAAPPRPENPASNAGSSRSGGGFTPERPRSMSNASGDGLNPRARPFVPEGSRMEQEKKRVKEKANADSESDWMEVECPFEFGEGAVEYLENHRKVIGAKSKKGMSYELLYNKRDSKFVLAFA